jgi:shikimate kinase
MNIVLIGYRGSGKTTVGKMLAAKLKHDFVDTDALIVERAGKSIREIFEAPPPAGGEKAFRDLESAVIAEVAARDNLVIATGGGALLRAENAANLKRAGKIIYLAADAQTLLARIQSDPATAAMRPTLTHGGIAGGSLEEIQRLLAIREPIYKSAADAIIGVAGKSPQQIAELALREI